MGKARLIALVLENARDEFPDVRLVVDNQDVRCHDTSLSCNPPY
jgi:hypothetical protein